VELQKNVVLMFGNLIALQNFQQILSNIAFILAFHWLRYTVSKRHSRHTSESSANVPDKSCSDPRERKRSG